MRSSWSSLVALLHVTSITNAASIWPSDDSLTVDVSSDIQKRATCVNGAYTTPIGLTFNVNCAQNIVLFDLDTPAGNRTATDVYDCARQCSLTRAQCYGAAYNVQSGACWLKNISVVNPPYINVINGDVNTQMVVVTPSSQIATSYDPTCGFDDASTQTTNDGLAYKVHCNRDIDGYNDDHIAPDFFPWHATSLSDCMNQCSSAHPLCSSVSFFPTMAQGYANCYPKTRMPNPVPNSVFVLTTGAPVHSGVGIITYGNNSDCKENGQIIASDNKTEYTTMCNQDRNVGNIDRFHVANLQDCVNACATYSGSGGKCIGALYDSMLTYGYNNCYLKNVTGTPVTSNATQGYTFARLSTVNDTSASSSNGGSSGGSSAWIAGPVVGGLVVLIAAVAIALVLKRRKRMARGKYSSVPAAGQHQYQENAGVNQSGYSEMVPAPPLANELSATPGINELGGGKVADEKFELAGSYPYR